MNGLSRSCKLPCVIDFPGGRSVLICRRGSGGKPDPAQPSAFTSLSFYRYLACLLYCSAYKHYYSLPAQ